MISVHPATADRWADLEAVMSTPGDPRRCWCQYFRLRGKAWSGSTVAANREGLKAQVGDPVAPGVVAYLDGEPAGWCAVAPAGEYPRLLASAVGRETAEETWGIVCFVVRREARGSGVAGELLDGAVRFAAEHGASAVEGYPVDVAAREAVSTSELYHGTLSMFLAAGFSEVRRPAAGRPVVRRELGARRRSRR